MLRTATTVSNKKYAVSLQKGANWLWNRIFPQWLPITIELPSMISALARNQSEKGAKTARSNGSNIGNLASIQFGLLILSGSPTYSIGAGIRHFIDWGP